MIGRFTDNEGDTFVLLEVLPDGEWRGHWDWDDPGAGACDLAASYVRSMFPGAGTVKGEQLQIEEPVFDMDGNVLAVGDEVVLYAYGSEPRGCGTVCELIRKYDRSDFVQLSEEDWRASSRDWDEDDEDETIDFTWRADFVRLVPECPRCEKRNRIATGDYICEVCRYGF